MKKLIIVIICCVSILYGCENNSETDTSKEVKVEDKTTEEIVDEEIADQTENVIPVSGSVFHNGIAFVRVKEETDTGTDVKISVINTDGEELFTYPEESELARMLLREDYDLGDFEDSRYVDKNGDYIWVNDTAINTKGEIIYDISEKYQGTEIGNGYMIVLEKPSGYQQQGIKMGVVDGYGNEIIPISEEFGELCGEELPNYRKCENGIAVFEKQKLVVDANQGIFYEGVEGYTEYKNNRMLVAWQLYKDKGSSIVDFGDYYSAGKGITISDDAVIIWDTKKENLIIQTFDVEGNLVNENTISDIKLDREELNFNDGISALYIDGMDGDYVTMIDEQGNILFDPIKHMSKECSDLIPLMYSEVSEGLLRIAVTEAETVFVNKDGEEVLNIPYDINCVSNCKDGRIAVNIGEEPCFYVNAETGEYIYPAMKKSENNKDDSEDGIKMEKEEDRIEVSYGLGMDREEFNNEIVTEDFEVAAGREDETNFDMECQEIGMYCALSNEKIYLIGLCDYETNYCIEGLYIGQYLVKGQEEIERRGYVVEEDGAVDGEEYDHYISYKKGKYRLEMRGRNGLIQTIWFSLEE